MGGPWGNRAPAQKSRGWWGQGKREEDKSTQVTSVTLPARLIVIHTHTHTHTHTHSLDSHWEEEGKGGYSFFKDGM